MFPRPGFGVRVGAGVLGGTQDDEAQLDEVVHQSAQCMSELARTFDEKIVAGKWLRLLSDLNLPEISAKPEEPQESRGAKEAVADEYYEAIEG